MSRFTVISTVADTEVGTIQSYDPFNASRVLHPTQVSHANIVVHRNNSTAGARRGPGSVTHSYRSYRSATGSMKQRKRTCSQRAGTASKLHTPRGSMSSIQSSRQGTPQVRANSRHKRGVDFSHVRRRSNEPQHQGTDRSRRAPASIAGDVSTYKRDTLSPSSPYKKLHRAKPVLHVTKPKDPNIIWNEELKQFTHSIAKDCDDAFRSSILSTGSLQTPGEERESSPFSLRLATPLSEKTTSAAPAKTGARPVSGLHRWDSRPLPPVPSEAESHVGGAIKSNGWPEVNQLDFSVSGATVNRSAANKGHVSQSPGTLGAPERRIVSAPVYAQYSKDARPLPVIKEGKPDRRWDRSDSSKQRIVSAPARASVPLPTPPADKGFSFLTRAENTIRVVHSPSAVKAAGPVEVPEPLNLRRKPSKAVPKTPLTGVPEVAPPGVDLRQQYAAQAKQSHSYSGSREISAENADSAVKKKKTSWFRRSSKENVQDSGVQSRVQSGSNLNRDSQSFGFLANLQASKKKSFVFPFWKSSKEDLKMSLAGTCSTGPRRLIKRKENL